MTLEENHASSLGLRFVAEQLTCRRSERLLFANLSFAVEQGRALMIAGPNGAGKSSLLRILAGFLSAEAGRYRLEGLGNDQELRQSCHYLGHRDGLRAALTARENLNFAADLLSDRALGKRKTAAEALDAVGLPFVADHLVGLLSAGQRRRVALARLLMAGRPLWLLDEPTSALDAASQERVADLLRAHLQQGGIAIVASHLPLGIDSATLQLGASA